MKVTIEIPYEWENEFSKDQFAECFSRVMADLSREEVRCCVGNYELETLAMLKEAFASKGEEKEIDDDSVEVSVLGSPYCTSYGTIRVPNAIVNAGKSKVIDYVNEHFNDIDFSEPDLDYRGINFDFEDEINGRYSPDECE